MRDPGRVHDEPVVTRKFPVGAVDPGVVKIGAKNARRKIVADQASGHPTQEAKGGDMRLGEGAGGHAKHRVTEQMAAESQHHDKRPHAGKLAR